MSDGRIVYVRWVDSMGGFGWLDRSDWKGEKETYCHTVGYVIADTEKNLVLAHTIDPESNNVHSPFEIPKSAIRAVIDLEPEDGAEELGGEDE